MRYKKAQTGETMTWMLAIAIILTILGVTFFIISISSWFKRDNYNTAFSEKTTDILATKSLAGYLLTKENGKTVFQQLEEENPDVFFNDFNGNLAKNIFIKIYSQDYSRIWMGIRTPKEAQEFKPNDYFVWVGPNGIMPEIKLNQSESVIMILTDWR